MVIDANVLGRGTKIELVLGCVSPRPHRIRVERLLPSPPVLYDMETGERISRGVEEVAPGLDVYGQRELAEIADDGQLRTDLLRRFVPPRQDADEREPVAEELRTTAHEIRTVRGELEELDEQLAALDGLEERLKLFRDAGIAEQLDAQAKHQSEGSLITEAEQRAVFAGDGFHSLNVAEWFDPSFLDEQSPETVTDPATVPALRACLQATEISVAFALATFEDALRDLALALGVVREGWSARAVSMESGYGKVQRALQAQGANADEYLTVLGRTQELRRQVPRRVRLDARLTELRTRRKSAMIDMENAEAAELRRLQKVARRVSDRLDGFVRVSVTAPEDRGAVVAHIREHTTGRLDRFEAWITSWPEFSLRALAALGRSGIENFAANSGISLDQAQRVTSVSEDVWLTMEEIQLTPRTDIELIGSDSEPVWRPLARLSTGQKATALLLLLLLEDTGPLIIDQPEDDLDNQFIFGGIVPRLRDLKGKRQLIFSTHNANIPVLGDAELIATMTVSHDADGPTGQSLEENRGSIDEPAVRELVEDLLEGGRRAFEMRRYRYGF